MPQFKVYRFDVTALTERQREILADVVIAQSEASDFNYERDQEWEDENYPNVRVAEICNYCHQEIDNGECGGEGEGSCTEAFIVAGYTGGDVEAYVRNCCSERDIENAPVPYRNDGMTYFDQLAYFVREYHDLPTPPKFPRRLP